MEPMHRRHALLCILTDPVYPLDSLSGNGPKLSVQFRHILGGMEDSGHGGFEGRAVGWV